MTKKDIKNKYLIIQAYSTKKQFNAKKNIFKKLGFDVEWLEYEHFIKPLTNYLYVDERGDILLSVELEKGMKPLKI